MSMRVLPLTDLHARNTKPKDKPYKLTEGGGLYVLITQHYYQIVAQDENNRNTSHTTFVLGRFTQIR